MLEECDQEQKDKYLNGYFEFTKNKLSVKSSKCDLDGGELLSTERET